jgi:hypothetical protein
MPIDRNDPEVRAFIAATGASTFTALAQAVADKFQVEMGASLVDLVKAVFLEVNPPTTSRSHYERDLEVMAFIADRHDLVTLEKIRRLGVAKFGVTRFPSHSQLHRLVRRLRRAAVAAG